ncbi:MAG: hypothetical protein IJE17_10860 [Clostridia bacterium]|nr:hypothetical protein [Clostridiales bacterium]MBQ2977978.1 hypothetical protein [Clostridia bacterium]MBQ6803577.1 hypothetical protein [Clostridia bacterium]
MSRMKKEEPRKNPSHDPMRDVENVVSATECTGLLPAQIQSEEEGEALSSLEGIHRIQPRFVDGNDEK